MPILEKINIRKIRSILQDPKKTAHAINLIYVTDKQPGITRLKRKNKFYYYSGNQIIEDEFILERIRKLVIPPAWENVWICNVENGHLQATGIDIRKRKQYKYHNLWNAVRNQTKFYRLHEFGKTIPLIRQQLQKDLLLPGLPVEKVLATVVSIMEKTSIRVGNSFYEKLYGSFGLTTLKDQHVKIDGSKIKFLFKGKKGVAHNISIKSKRLAKIIQNCRDIPGKELFQYIDNEGNYKSIDSGMVNNYLKSITSQDFTAKDFRTWSGTIEAIKAFKNICKGEETTSKKNNIIQMLNCVAAHLGNTRNICKKYYIHPAIIELYEGDRLNSYFQLVDQSKLPIDEYQLSYEEMILMNILEKEKLI